MERICLDFETALDFLRGDHATIEKLKYYADTEEICITSITLMQLMESISKPEVVNAFANGVTVLPLDRKAAQIAAHLMKDMHEESGRNPKMENVMTAAICIASGAFLYSRSHSKFDGIKGLRRV